MTHRTGYPPAEGLAEALEALVRTGHGDAFAGAARAPRLRAKTPRRADALEWQCRAMLESLPVPVYTIDAEGRLTFFNRAAIAFSGRKPRLGLDEWCVTWRLYWPDGTFLPHEQCPAAVALKEGRPVRGIGAVAERPDGLRQPFLPFPTPLLDVFGRVTGAVNMLIDLSSGWPDGTSGANRGALSTNMLQDILIRACSEAPNAKERAEMSILSRRIGSIATAQDILDREDGAPDYDARALAAAVCAMASQWLGRPPAFLAPGRPCRLPWQTARPLALILAELIAIAGQRNSEAESMVEVALWEKSETLELSVARRDRARSRFGQHSSGLGPVMGLARQIGAGLEVDREGKRWIVQLRSEKEPRTKARGFAKVCIAS